MPWGWCLHQKPCKPYPKRFNSTPMERQSLAGNSHPISSLCQAVLCGKCEQPSRLSVIMSQLQKYQTVTASSSSKVMLYEQEKIAQQSVSDGTPFTPTSAASSPVTTTYNHRHPQPHLSSFPRQLFLYPDAL